MLCSRFTANQSLLQTTRDGVGWTMQYHSDSAGSIIADERQIGLAPNRGAELCTAVEVYINIWPLRSRANMFGYRPCSHSRTFTRLWAITIMRTVVSVRLSTLYPYQLHLTTGLDNMLLPQTHLLPVILTRNLRFGTLAKMVSSWT